MPVFEIVYHTFNKYTSPVRNGVIELMVLPEENPGQRCLSQVVSNSLEIPAQYPVSLYGARLIRYRIPLISSTFEVTVAVTVERDLCNPFGFWEILPEDQEKMICDHGFMIDNHQFLHLTHYTTPKTEIIPGHGTRTRDETIFEFMQRINHFVFHFVTYETGVTNTQTLLDEILRLRKGVCQDFAHLFIAIMRMNGIPARYVSGYINQGEGFTGAAAMHAWAEALLPGVGWIGLDPSNNLLADYHYIKVGHGADYSDCMPIKGILRSEGNMRTEYTVQVMEQQTQ
jgi:transglutaminase-like putative cysteine protease